MKDSGLTVFKDIGVKGLPGLMICLISRTVFTDLPCDHQHICYALVTIAPRPDFKPASLQCHLAISS